MARHEATEGCKDCDFEGNNAAFTCPECGKVYLVSAWEHNPPDADWVQGFDGRRSCPNPDCGHSTATVHTGQTKAGDATRFPRGAWVE